MKEQDLADGQEIVKLLEEGRADRRDLLALLMYMREELPNDQVKDIAHFVAHADRDRGYAFTYTKGFVDHLVSVFQGGGTLTVKEIYNTDVLIGQFCRDARKLGIVVSREKLTTHSNALKALLSSLLDGVSFKIANPRVTSCRFTLRATAADGGKSLLLEVFSDGSIQGTIRWPRNVGITFAVFDEPSA